jgi:hypothetical protein
MYGRKDQDTADQDRMLLKGHAWRWEEVGSGKEMVKVVCR